MFFINTYLETLFFLKRLDYRKDALNHHSITILMSATSYRKTLSLLMLKWLQVTFENDVCNEAFCYQHYSVLMSNNVFYSVVSEKSMPWGPFTKMV